MEWIHVSDRPLITQKSEHAWETTEDGSEDFLAAVSYNDSSRPNETLWWVRHCVIEESGLCVVGDDGNEPASWSVHSVEYWMPIVLPDQDFMKIKK